MPVMSIAEPLFFANRSGFKFSTFTWAEKDGKLVLKFCASAGENARKAVLTCKDKAGTETQYAFDIPALKAGKCAEVTLPAKELPYTAKIKIDGKKEYTVFF